MRKHQFSIKIFLVFMTIFSMFKSSSAKQSDQEKIANIYKFSFQTFDGKELPLSNFRGKVLLIVNTASKCGFTGQYSELEKLYKKYQARGLEIIAVPSNDFGAQEPGDNQEIQRFCKLNYGVSFLVTKKEIVSGDKAHPFYKFAKNELGFGSAPKWNFHKYLINRDGKIVDFFISSTSPESEKITNSIENLL